MSRRETREKAIQCLYQMEISKINASEALESLDLQHKEYNEVDGPITRDVYLEKLVKEVEAKMDTIDNEIRPLLKGWTLERLPYIDRAILRLSVYELLYQDEIPDPVVINEGIELAKTFSDDQSSKFINGILSTILKGKS